MHGRFCFSAMPAQSKTHLATALCVAACQQRRRVRFTTASRLVNELVEAREEHELSRVIRRYARYELLCIDELGYVPLADVGAELLFQVVSERCERAALVITTNLPFSEWTQVLHERPPVQGTARPSHGTRRTYSKPAPNPTFRRTLKSEKKTIKA